MTSARPPDIRASFANWLHESAPTIDAARRRASTSSARIGALSAAARL